MESLQIKLKHFGEVSLEVSNTYHNLAMCLTKMKRYDESIDFRYKCIAIQQQLQLTQHPSFNNSVKGFRFDVKSMMGDADCGREVFLKAIKVTEKLFGK